jgi:heat shock protein beta
MKLTLFAVLALCTVAVFGAETVQKSEALSEADRTAITENQETHEFQAEVSRLMDIIINSLYSNREIFLRELISNAADALDKIRFMSLTDEKVLGEAKDFKINIKFDKKSRTISITDTGVGMTKADLIKNLGIVAKSGTTEFIEAAAAGADLSLIGQFGVGFYSVYLVADKVTVISKNNDDDQHIWESSANSVFTVAKDPRGNTLGRGTSVIIQLKEDAEEFLDESTLTKLVTRYSQFINFPIGLWTSKEIEEQVPEEKEEKAASEGSKEEELEITEDEDDGQEAKIKTVKKTVWDWKILNEAKPLWTRNPKDISEEEYVEFYKQISKDTEAPMDYIHFVAEGEITFRAILYIPSKVDPKIYDKFYEKSTSLKLFVRRVLISDEFDDLLPRYLNFIKGVVDSDDLPLNVSRETLAQSRVLKVMSKKLTRKVLEMLRKIATRSKGDDDESSGEVEEEGDEPTDYDKFWAQYSKSIKMGVMDDKKNKSKLTKLLRYKSSKSNNKFTSFEQYVDRMKEDQNKIFFATGESVAQIEMCPAMEKFIKADLEVIYMDEAIDEYTSQHVHEFDGIEPQNIVRESLSLPESKDFKEKKSNFKDLVDWFKKVFGSAVHTVAVSQRLVTSPAMLAVSEYGWTGNMERIMKAQALNDQKTASYNAPKKIFEFNPYHPIIKEIETKRQANAEDAELKELAHLLYDSALVTSGFSMENADGFAKRVHRYVALGLDVDPDAEIPEEEEEKKEESKTDAETEAAEDAAEEKEANEDAASEKEEL